MGEGGAAGWEGYGGVDERSVVLACGLQQEHVG